VLLRPSKSTIYFSLHKKRLATDVASREKLYIFSLSA